ncbi:hypothetical protein LB467_04370 [Salegentibacter sp. JZCK2]|uniref:hypothetical protein n=1 Tax=Salegentibacter tibetensis TaxID=2873600 RepID=UPI001CC9B1EC|nr:hypothetical protein [Salegentibacter tibetensis]MBZ9728912.1 hypothetical protein [Salegentibacter tibetensis]
MELQKIRELLEKYDAGKTTLAQEDMLREYFQHNEVPDDLKSYQLIFAFSEKSRKPIMERKVQLPASEKGNKYLWTAIAASVILVVGLFFFQNKPMEMNDSDLGTIQDKEEALQKSMEALKMVSELMNEGKEDLIYLKEFNNTKNKFIKTE